MEIYAIRFNGLKKPMGFDMNPVVCSWKVKNANGKKAVWTKIQIATDAAFSKDLYVKEGETLDAAGEELQISLQPYTRYYCKITVASDLNETATSPVTWFETGKMDEQWQGAWVGVRNNDTHPEFCKTFCINEGVERARMYICGLGLFEASVNGKRVGNEQLTPFLNDYEEHFQYCTYDVTSLLESQNKISVLLGDGWYRGHFGLGEPTHYERPLALMAELRIWHTDGTQTVISTDETWQYRRSFTELSDIYNGEIQNYRDWKAENNPWTPVQTVAAPGRLCDRYSPYVHDMEILPVREVIHTPAGETVLDFGQNFAGHVVCTQGVPAGTVMTWEFGEILQHGNFYRANYRNAESKFTYLSDGVAREIRPRFTFFGFRYVKVSGLQNLDPACFTGHALYSQMDRTGWIRTGNDKINQLFSNSLWGLKSNFLDLPTDCPQRDERLGWSGDAQVFASTAAFHMDTRAFYHKFLKDLRSDQLRNHGAAAVYLPNAFPGLYAGIWSDVATVIPSVLYEYYGNKTLLAQHYPLMKDWVDFVFKQDCKRGRKDLYDFGFQFGDWLALDGATPQSKFGRTDTGYVVSAYYYASTLYVAQAAAMLELPEAAEYQTRAQAIKAAIEREYFTPTGRLAVDTQTGYLVALKFGLGSDREKLIAALQDRIKKDCKKLKGGFVGSTIMNCVLAENGMAEQAYDFLFYEGFPGWLYAVNLGATTIWERWNSVLPNGLLSGTEMNSLNHYSYGAVVEFLYRYAAGIQPLEPGFRSAKISPVPHVKMGYMECSFDSIYGTYVCNWKIESDGSLTFHIEIPFGCRAELCLPEQESCWLNAGQYDFRICPKKDYLALYTVNTPLELLFTDPRAVEILEKYIPETVRGTDRNDEEAMSKGLFETRYRAALFRQPTENIDRAIAEICALRA